METAVTPIAKSLTIHETGNGKLPGCYAGKTFELSYSPIADLKYAPAKYICYESKLKNGKTVRFQYFLNQHPNRPTWHVVREGCFRGTWLYSVEVS